MAALLPALAAAQGPQPGMALSAATASEAVPTGRSLVLEVQQRLWARGFNPGPVDGILGEQTREAIRAFELDQGIPTSGEASVSVWRALGRRDADDRAVDSSPSADATASQASTTTAIDHPAAKAVERMPAAEVASAAILAGTTWDFEDDSGARFTVTFEPDGRLAGPAFNAGWIWTQDGGDVELKYENRIGGSSLRSGHLVSAYEMAGRGISTRGGDWSWQARRSR